MNKHINIAQDWHRLQPQLPAAPRKYTAADIFFFLNAGLIREGARFELLDGEIVPMSPKGINHEATRLTIARWLTRPWARKFDSLQELTLTVAGDSVLEPDFAVFKHGFNLRERPLTGADIYLIIEVADSSLDHGLKTKSQKYATFGVAEYWVVDVNTGQTHVHRGAVKKGWNEIQKVPSGKPLSPLCAPKAFLKL